jgi:putative peptide maturation system protein
VIDLPSAALLRGAAELLCRLSQHELSDDGAEAQARAWGRENAVEVFLHTARPPGRTAPERDLYLSVDNGATVGMTVCQDDGLPWLVSYADHWAANFVVTVNGKHVTVQDALRELSVAFAGAPGTADLLVDHALEAQAAADLDRSIAPAELQAEVDSIRRRHGLASVSDTERWLALHGMTREDLGRLAAAAVIGRRLQAQVLGDDDADWFGSRAALFDRLAVTSAWFTGEAAARDAARSAQDVGLPAAVQTALHADAGLLRSCSETVFAIDAPTELRDSEAGCLRGPLRTEHGWWLGVVHRRSAARLDEVTAGRLRQARYAEWLAGEREKVTVEWHWC